MWWNFIKRKTATLPYMIGNLEALNMWKEKKATFIDVRTDAEYAEGHIPESICLPLDQLSRRYREISRKETVIIVCQGGSRSKRAVEFLQRYGYRNVYCLTGGLQQWTGVTIK